jgi:hypothetical protein
LVFADRRQRSHTRRAPHVVECQPKDHFPRSPRSQDSSSFHHLVKARRKLSRIPGARELVFFKNAARESPRAKRFELALLSRCGSVSASWRRATFSRLLSSANCHENQNSSAADAHAWRSYRAPRRCTAKSTLATLVQEGGQNLSARLMPKPLPTARRDLRHCVDLADLASLLDPSVTRFLRRANHDANEPTTASENGPGQPAAADRHTAVIARPPRTPRAASNESPGANSEEREDVGKSSKRGERGASPNWKRGSRRNWTEALEPLRGNEEATEAQKTVATYARRVGSGTNRGPAWTQRRGPRAIAPTALWHRFSARMAAIWSGCKRTHGPRQVDDGAAWRLMLENDHPGAPW